MSDLEKRPEMTDEEYIKQGANKVQFIKWTITVLAIAAMVGLCIKYWNGDGIYQIELDADKNQGYQWTYTTEDSDVIKEQQSYYASGLYVFVFEGLKEGEADVTFTLTQEGSSDVLETQVHHLKVNKDNRITLGSIEKQ